MAYPTTRKRFRSRKNRQILSRLPRCGWAQRSACLLHSFVVQSDTGLLTILIPRKDYAMSAAEQHMQNQKKPYEKPQVVYKGLLEAMAAACQTPQAKAAVGAGCDQFQLFS